MGNIKLWNAPADLVKATDWSEFFAPPVFIEVAAAQPGEPATDPVVDKPVITDDDDAPGDPPYKEWEDVLAKDMWGTAGNDRFVVDGKSTVAPLIFDFAAGDKIVLDIGLSAFTDDMFCESPEALEPDDRITYANGTLKYDPDGSGPEAAVDLAVLVAGPALTASDFAVV